MGNGAAFCCPFPITRSVSDKTERQTGNSRGLKHKKVRPPRAGHVKDNAQRDAAEAARALNITWTYNRSLYAGRAGLRSRKTDSCRRN